MTETVPYLFREVIDVSGDQVLGVTIYGTSQNWVIVRVRAYSQDRPNRNEYCDGKQIAAILADFFIRVGVILPKSRAGQQNFLHFGQNGQREDQALALGPPQDFPGFALGGEKGADQDTGVQQDGQRGHDRTHGLF
jgi:hypothetical protein